MIGRMRPCWVLVLSGVMGMTAASAVAASSPIGLLEGSKNATLDGQIPLAHTTVLSGDTLHVKNGLAMVALKNGNRLILGRRTVVSFSRESGGVEMSLTSGKISLYHVKTGGGLRVKVGDVIVVPARGSSTLGQIVMVDGLLLVTTKDGMLQVEESGATKEVSKGSTIRIPTTISRVPTAVPAGASHTKHIIDHKSLVALMAGAGAAGVTLATMAITQTSTTVSPVTPTP